MWTLEAAADLVEAEGVSLKLWCPPATTFASQCLVVLPQYTYLSPSPQVSSEGCRGEFSL